MIRPTRDAAASAALITHQDPKNPGAEAFRVLRTNLQFLSLDKPLKGIVVTSATPGEGKSFNSGNLAIAYAQTGVKVCLVDADLRRPRVAKLFGLDNLTGLTTALVGNKPYNKFLQEGKVPGLAVLTSGPIPPNPAELLGSNRMETLMGELEQAFDMVIYDTSPVLAVADASILGSRTGGVLLVARAGVVSREEVRRAREALVAVKANLLGVILDGVKPNGPGSYGYYYYYSSSEDRK